MYQYCNLNPHGLRVGDCVVRAVAKALDKTWEEIYIDLSLQGYLMGDLLASNSVWGEYLKNNGFTRHIVPTEFPECYDIRSFSKDHSSGVFVVGTGTHATAIIDGNIYDIWDCSEEKPLYYYQKGE